MGFCSDPCYMVRKILFKTGARGCSSIKIWKRIQLNSKFSKGGEGKRAILMCLSRARGPWMDSY